MRRAVIMKKLDRIMSMGLMELAGRGRQELSRRFDRLGWSDGDGDSSAPWSKLAPLPELTGIRARARAGDVTTAAEMLLDQFRVGAPGRFFAGVAPDHEAATLSGADDVLTRAASLAHGRFDLLGYE